MEKKVKQIPVRPAIIATRVAISVFAVSMTMLAPLITRIGADFGLGVGESGFLFTAYYISNIVFCLITGKIISLLGKRTAMKIGLFGYAAATLAFSQTRSFLLACIFISCMGALATFIEAVGMDIVDDLSVDSAASNLSVTHGLAGLGGAVGVLYSGLMLHFGFDWRMIYMGLAAAVLIAGVVFCLIPCPGLHDGEAGGLGELRGYFTRVDYLPSFGALFLYVGAEGAATGWLATYMSNALGYSAIVSAFGTAVIWLLVAVGRITCAQLVHKYSIRRLEIILSLIAVSSILIVAGAPAPVLFWIAVLGIGVGISGMWPLCAATLLNQERNGGTIMAVILFFGYAGSSVIPYVVGLIGDAFGMNFAMAASAAVFAAFGLTVAFLIPRKFSAKR
ncbi:MAG: MFS transporter [Butyricicoccus sp.]|nr:MFS transporter [Butyricicoccus sp.]